MYLLALPFTFFEIAIFSMAVFVFLMTVRFFIARQKSLENLLPEINKKKTHIDVSIDREGFIVPTAKDEIQRKLRYA